MAGKFEITKAGDGTFSFELFIDDNAVGKSPVLTRRTLAREVLRLLRRTAE